MAGLLGHCAVVLAGFSCVESGIGAGARHICVEVVRKQSRSRGTRLRDAEIARELMAKNQRWRVEGFVKTVSVDALRRREARCLSLQDCGAFDPGLPL